MKKPLISIIVPIYNVEKYLPECIESILGGTYKKIELILVDDGSPDHCGEICDCYAKKDKRVRVIHKKNGGLSDARNAGLRRATGDYIGFVDSDDHIAPDMYEKMLTACVNHGADIAICGRTNIAEDGAVISEQFTLPEETIFSSEEIIDNMLTWGCCDIASWDKLYKAELFSGIIFPIGVWSEDATVIPVLAHRSKRAVHIGAAKYYYRNRGGSITNNNFSEKTVTMLEQAQRLKSFIYKNHPALKGSADIFMYYYCVNFLRKAYHADGRKYGKEIRRGFQLINRNKNIWKAKNVPFTNKMRQRIKFGLTFLKNMPYKEGKTI